MTFSSFDEWWEPFALGVGPAGAYYQQLDVAARAELLAHVRERFPVEPFTIAARAWAAKGVVA